MFDSTAVWVALGIFIALLAAGIGFPLPEEVPIATAGVLARQAAEPPPPLPPFRAEPVPPEFLANWSIAPQLGFPGGIPWAALAKTSEYHVAPPHPLGAWMLVIAGAAPAADLPAAVPWPALAQAGSQIPSRPISAPWWFLLPVCILGVVICDVMLYVVGRVGGLRVLKLPFVRQLLPHERLERIERNFQKYGVLILLFARLLPTIRSPIFLTAGIMRLPLRRFVLADGIYAIPGVSLLFFLAYLFTDKVMRLVHRLEDNVARIRTIGVLALIVAVVIYFLIHFLRRPVTTGDPKEIPLIGDQVAAKIQSELSSDGQPPFSEEVSNHTPTASSKSEISSTFHGKERHR